MKIDNISNWSFCVSQNPKHCSNEAETIGLINSVINPYLMKKCKELGLPQSQKALLIWDVLRGQKTQKVCLKLSSLNIDVISDPANMTTMTILPMEVCKVIFKHYLICVLRVKLKFYKIILRIHHIMHLKKIFKTS